MRHRRGKMPAKFAAKQAGRPLKLLADANEIEGSQILLGRGQQRGCFGRIPRKIPSDAGELMCVRILNDRRAILEIMHEGGKWQLFGLRCYGVALFRAPPVSVGRNNPQDRVAEQRHTITAAAEARLSQDAEMSHYEWEPLESRGRHQADFVFGQMRAEVRRHQVVPADGQQGIPACLRNVVEDVMLRKHAQAALRAMHRASYCSTLAGQLRFRSRWCECAVAGSRL